MDGEGAESSGGTRLPGGPASGLPSSINLAAMGTSSRSMACCNSVAPSWLAADHCPGTECGDGTGHDARSVRSQLGGSGTRTGKDQPIEIERRLDIKADRSGRLVVDHIGAGIAQAARRLHVLRHGRRGNANRGEREAGKQGATAQHEKHAKPAALKLG